MIRLNCVGCSAPSLVATEMKQNKRYPLSVDLCGFVLAPGWRLVRVHDAPHTYFLQCPECSSRDEVSP